MALVMHLVYGAAVDNGGAGGAQAHPEFSDATPIKLFPKNLYQQKKV